MHRLNNNSPAFSCQTSLRTTNDNNRNVTENDADDYRAGNEARHTGPYVYQSAPMMAECNRLTPQDLLKDFHKPNENAERRRCDDFMASLRSPNGKGAFWSPDKNLQHEGIPSTIIPKDNVPNPIVSPFKSHACRFLFKEFLTDEGDAEFRQDGNADMALLDANASAHPHICLSSRSVEKNMRDSMLKNQEIFETPKNQISLSSFHTFIDNLDPTEQGIYHFVTENEEKFISYELLARFLSSTGLTERLHQRSNAGDLTMSLKAEFKKYHWKWPFIVFPDGLLYIADEEKRNRFTAACEVLNIEKEHGAKIYISSLKGDREANPNDPLLGITSILLGNIGDQLCMEELVERIGLPAEKIHEIIEVANDQFEQHGWGQLLRQGVYGYGVYLTPNIKVNYGGNIHIDDEGNIYLNDIPEKQT